LRRDAAGLVRLRAGVGQVAEWVVPVVAEWVGRSFLMEVRAGREVQDQPEEMLRPPDREARGPSLVLGCRLVRRDDGGTIRDLPRA